AGVQARRRRPRRRHRRPVHRRRPGRAAALRGRVPRRPAALAGHPGPGAVTSRALARALAAYALAVAAASAAVVVWLSPGAADPGRTEIASAWRNGARVARRVSAGDGARALAADPSAGLEAPGTALAVERVQGE